MQKSLKKLTLTVGITTCYGDESIIDTVKSVRASAGVGSFRFIIVADRVPISISIKKQLKKYRVELIENKKEASQVKKQKQILSLTKSDLIIFTQDDVLLEKDALSKTIKEFEKDSELTMISILNKPIKPTNLFEAILNIGTNLANKMAKYWKNGDNYLSVIGRFMAFRTEIMKNKFRMPDVATSDAYYYFENKRVGGKYKYLPQIGVIFKNPQNKTEQLRKSSRFQHSKLEMSAYFKNLEEEYKVPLAVSFRALISEFFISPILTIFYLAVFVYTRVFRTKPKHVLNPVWEVDVSTKKVISS